MSERPLTDRWVSLGTVPTGLTEDRYVSAVEVREVNDIPKNAESKTVGGRFVFHHMNVIGCPLCQGVSQLQVASPASR